MMSKAYFLTILIYAISLYTFNLKACTVLYYNDTINNKIYIANNEDYWYDTKVYLQILPAKETEFARLWYGWDDFAQGGVNSVGLFFDGAATPKQPIPKGYNKPKGNIGDRILANCSTVFEAIDYLEREKIALGNAHIMFGDKSGNAVVVEWINGEKKLIWISENKLVMTNFSLSDTSAGSYPCRRYESVHNYIEEIQKDSSELTFLKIANALGQAAQTPTDNENKQIGGTLYSSFINLTKMEFILVYKLDSQKTTILNLNHEFQNSKKRKIRL